VKTPEGASNDDELSSRTPTAFEIEGKYGFVAVLCGV